MIQNVLGVTVPEMEASQRFDNFRMQRRQAGFHYRFLAQADDGFIHFLAHFAYDFLDPGWVDASVSDQPHHGFPGDFAPNRIETRKQDRARGVVNEHGHSRGSLESPDVPALAAYDPAFDFITLQGHGRRGIL